MNFRLTNLIPDLLIEILLLCNYKSIIITSLTCKTINNLNYDNIILQKSKLYIKETPTKHIINIDYISKNVNNIIMFLLNNDIDFKYNDEIIHYGLNFSYDKTKNIAYVSKFDLNITDYKNYRIANCRDISVYIDFDKSSKLSDDTLLFYLLNKKWLESNINTENFTIFDVILKFYYK